MTRLQSIWGADNLVRFSPAAVDSLGLPSDARRILVEVGLPRLDEPIFEPEQPKLIEVPRRAGVFCRIGNDYGTAICVDRTSGAVLSLSPSGVYPDRFVNSSVPLFVEFMTALELERPQLSALTDEEGARRVVQLTERLRERDPRAVADPERADQPETWWSAYLWELERGLR